GVPAGDAGVGRAGRAVLVLAEDGDHVEGVVLPHLGVLGELAGGVDRRDGHRRGGLDHVGGGEGAAALLGPEVVPEAARVDLVRAEVDARVRVGGDELGNLG